MLPLILWPVGLVAWVAAGIGFLLYVCIELARQLSKWRNERIEARVRLAMLGQEERIVPVFGCDTCKEPATEFVVVDDVVWGFCKVHIRQYTEEEDD